MQLVITWTSNAILYNIWIHTCIEKAATITRHK